MRSRSGRPFASAQPPRSPPRHRRRGSRPRSAGSGQDRRIGIDPARHTPDAGQVHRQEGDAELGGPKIQNRCCHRTGSPPRSGSKKGQPSERCSSAAAAMDATSMKDRPNSRMSDPMPSSSVASGGYMNQPELGATSKINDPITNLPHREQKHHRRAPANCQAKACCNPWHQLRCVCNTAFAAAWVHRLQGLLNRQIGKRSREHFRRPTVKQPSQKNRR